ncbi:MAG: 50S ribosomal protein L22 [Candidatus Methanospirareceae archaeon]
MGRVKFCTDRFDEETTAKAMAYELHISPKHSFEICRAIKGMRVRDAEKFLKEVIEMKRPVPFKRYKKKVAHKRGLEKWFAGRYPVKAAKEVLKLIMNAKNNAEYKGLDADNMRICHIATKKGRTIRSYFPRAFGRATPKNIETVTIEVILEEVGG